jgi:hypothetical protein
MLTVNSDAAKAIRNALTENGILMPLPTQVIINEEGTGFDHRADEG